jgi:hypothetical protein
MIPSARLSNLWKPVSIALALVGATIYAGLVVHEISRSAQSGAERRVRVDASRAFVDDEAMLGAIWAHRHHPFDSSWCPDYSHSFKIGCAEAIEGGVARKLPPPR